MHPQNENQLQNQPSNTNNTKPMPRFVYTLYVIGLIIVLVLPTIAVLAFTTSEVFVDLLRFLTGQTDSVYFLPTAAGAVGLVLLVPSIFLGGMIASWIDAHLPNRFINAAQARLDKNLEKDPPGRLVTAGLSAEELRAIASELAPVEESPSSSNSKPDHPRSATRVQSQKLSKVLLKCMIVSLLIGIPFIALAVGSYTSVNNNMIKVSQWGGLKQRTVAVSAVEEIDITCQTGTGIRRGGYTISMAAQLPPDPDILLFQTSGAEDPADVRQLIQYLQSQQTPFTVDFMALQTCSNWVARNGLANIDSQLQFITELSQTAPLPSPVE